MSDSNHDLHSLDELKKQLGTQIQSLPCLPPVLLGVQKAISEGNVGARELAQVILADPSLTARVLKMANSMYYAPQHKIRTVTQAILIMGFETVRNLVLGLSVYDMLSNLPKAEDYRSVWRHSLCCGICSRDFAAKLKNQNAEQAFVAGLLHDLGKLILGQFFADTYAEVLQTVHDQKISFHRAEMRVLGYTHEDAGRCVAEYWGFPGELANVVARHEASTVEELGRMTTPLQRIVAVANQAAFFLYREDSVTPMKSSEIQSFCLHGLGIGNDALLDIFAQIKAEVSHTARLLNIAIDEWKYGDASPEPEPEGAKPEDARLEFLLLSGDLLAENHPFPIYWRQTAEALSQALGMEGILLLFRDPSAGVLKTRHWYGHGMQGKADLIAVKPDTPNDLASMVYQQRKPITVTDENLQIFTCSESGCLFDVLGTSRLAAVAVPSMEGPVVLVAVRSPQGASFDDKDLRVLSAFGRDLGQALMV